MRAKKWLVAGVAAGALALLGGGAVLAQSADGEGDSFLDRVAQKLGVEPAELETAIRDVRNEDIDAAVESGRLTQEQADRLKERLEEWPDGDFGHGPFGFRGPLPVPPGDFEFHGKPFEFRGDGPPFHLGFGLGLREAVDDLSSFLGISTEQLLEELSVEDATLASVAEAHGKSRDELKSYITTKVDERLDQAVADGNLTQEMADNIRERLDGVIDAMIDGRFGFGGRGFRFGGALGEGDGGFDFEFHFNQGGDEDSNEDSSPESPVAPQSGTSEGSGRS